MTLASPLRAPKDGAAAPSRLRRGVRLAALALILGFVLLRLPYAIWPITPHPDEHFYTYGAAQMRASGDWLVPVRLDGELRLRKPPLAYWQVAAGFAAFGETPLGAKALWLAGAAATLALTFRLARVAGASGLGALLAVAALAGHAGFARASTQHLPDGPLILGLTLALAAFATILARPPGARPHAAFYAGYLGLAVGVLSKGLLPLTLLATFWAARTLWPAGLDAAERRHERRAVALAALVALSWFAAVAARHPVEMAEQFFGDQVARKAAFDAAAFLANMRKTVSDLVLPFAPFLLALFAARIRPGIGAQGASAPRFLILWCGVVMGLFAFADPLFERYVLPAAPAAAALLGLWASRLEPARLARRLTRLAAGFALLPVIAALAAAAALVRFGQPGAAAAAGALALAVGAAALSVARAGRAAPAAALLGATYPLIALTLVPLHLALARPMPAERLAAALAAEGRGAGDVTILREPELTQEIGFATGDIAAFRYAARPDLLRSEDRLVVSDRRSFAPELEKLGYDIRYEHGLPVAEIDLAEFWPTLRSGDLAAFARTHGQPLLIARER